MENKTIISVLIPTYNRPKYLIESLESAICQKGFIDNELEFIVSDNSDNNETAIILEKYIKLYPNINIIYNKNNENLGMIGNWNKLLEIMNGEFFIFLSDDDKFYSEKCIMMLYEKIISEKCDLVYGNNVGLSNNGFIHIKTFQATCINIFNSHSIGFGGTLYRKTKYKYDLNAGPYADYDFNMYYVLNKKILYIDIDTIIYRSHKGQCSSSISGINDKKMKLYIFKKNSYFKYNLMAYIKILFLYFLIKIFIFLGVYRLILKFNIFIKNIGKNS